MNPNQNPNMYPGQVPSQLPQPMPPQQPVSYSQQKKQHSFARTLVDIILVVLLIVAAVFGIWAYGERAKFKDQSDQLVNNAVEQARQEVAAEKDVEFAETSKSPYETYFGPAEFGSIEITYPKTWSAYVVQSERGGTVIDGYMHPGVVPGANSGTAFALRFQVLSKAYDEVASGYSGSIEKGTASAAPINVDGVEDVRGLRVDGEIERGKQGSLVIFPIRDKTLLISTESSDYLNDFNGIILANLRFIP